ncbi:MAG: ferredoxin [Candidatus Pacearchaeota archaeon]|jgi:ferredoxin
MYKVSVDKKLCIGCGACVSICEKVFKLKDGKANVKVAKTNEECAKEAADSCPVNAISISKT